ncbi:hypothetical protein HOE04_01230 [archaeon]|jgi:hypothetical protein|nr:hypothetical protein [archaeon]
MESTSIRAFNKTFFIASIITWILSFYPKIDNTWRIILLVTALALLITTYFLSYTGSVDKVEKEINKIEKRLKEYEKLLNTIRDIVILNKVKKIK